MEESEDLIKTLSEKHSGVCLIGFSRGKDSIASWIQLKKHFKTIIPYYLKMIPDEMSFETESLKYYEEVFETKIIRLISPSFYRMISQQIFQAPDKLPIVDSYGKIKRVSYQDIQSYVKQANNLPDSILTGIGVTENDSFTRRMAIRKNGPVNAKNKEFYPIYDFTKTEIFSLIEKNNIKLPKDYNLWGKTFDGLDYRFTKPLKEQYPEDYEKLKLYFPLLDAEMIRYEQV